MLYEYAVEPEAVAESWPTFRYLIEKFGFEQGRLISQFPKTWKRMVFEAARSLPDGMGKTSIEEKLRRLPDSTFVRAGRPYSMHLEWLDNAIAEHARAPFHAIIARTNSGSHEAIVRSEDVEDTHPRITAPIDARVARTASELGKVASALLTCCREAAFIDSYFDPSAPRYRATLREFLRIIATRRSPLGRCEVHFVDGNRTPPPDAFERECGNWLARVIPAGVTVTFFRWREKKPGGEDFHARYILTDIGGLHIDAGLDEAAGQTTDVRRMGSDLAMQRLADIDRDANVYELVEPVLQVTSTGYVERV